MPSSVLDPLAERGSALPNYDISAMVNRPPPTQARVMRIVVAVSTCLLLSAAACSSSGGGAGKSVGAPAGSSTSSPRGVTSSVSRAAAGGAGVSAWCDELAVAGPAVISAADPNSLPPDWQRKAEALAADAPSAIRPDVVALIKGDEKIINGDASGDQTPAFLQAGQHVVAWLTTNCPDVLKQLNR